MVAVGIAVCLGSRVTKAEWGVACGGGRPRHTQAKEETDGVSNTCSTKRVRSGFGRVWSGRGGAGRGGWWRDASREPDKSTAWSQGTTGGSIAQTPATNRRKRPVNSPPPK
ncbi:hypothetical protein E2C01_055285 [Portunus trituberculatus]|uniref:Uncharacterized protein n=1 Tax=Portunus trituberculatus TaxID=210409 RepID=A0A5B7GWE5_PORTR|nr:hypothetical protein [Portunus trituberculatus]